MDSSWSKADIHIHTIYSDGTAGIREVLEHAAGRAGLPVIAITDHDTIEGALEARRLAPRYGIDVIVGEEISTAEGHLLALFIERRVAPKRPVAETIAAVHAQGGICIAAHPYDFLVPSLGRYGLRRRATRPDGDWQLDGIEGFNASLWLTRSNARAETVGKELGLAICGGSDSHHLATIGLGYTLFPGHSAADLRQAILAGQTRADGSYWQRSHNIEVASRWLWLLAQRTLRLQPAVGSWQ